MFRTIIWFLYFWYYLLTTLPALKKVEKLQAANRHQEKEAIILKTTQEWAGNLVRLTGTTVDVKGLENIPKTGPFLIVSNHQGNFDIPLLLSRIPRPIGFISKIEVKKLPIIRTWMEYMNCVFLDRKDRRQAIKAINNGAKNLQDGARLVIFPEGTRSKGMKMNEFKSGSFKLAQKSGVPIVPVAINGSYKIMEANGSMMKPAEVTITILPQIKEETYSGKDLKQLASEVQEIIAAELE